MDNFIQSLKPRIKSLRESLYLIARNKLSLTALIILVLLIVGALLAPYIIPYPEDLADATHTQIKLQAPSLEHLMGTDELGRDFQPGSLRRPGVPVRGTGRRWPVSCHWRSPGCHRRQLRRLGG